MTTPAVVIDLKEYLGAYLAEVEEQLRAANDKLLEIENAERAGSRSPRAVRDLFRALHTIKGLSAMVGVEPVVAIAHRMESVLRASDAGGGKLPPGAVDRLLQGVREIETRVRELANGKPVTPPPAALLDALEHLDRVEADTVIAPAATLDLEPEIASKLPLFEVELLVSGAAAGRRALRVDFVPSAEKAAAGLSITTVRVRLSAIADVIKVVPVAREKTGGAGLSFVLLFLTALSDQEIVAAVGIDPGSIRELTVVPVAAIVPTGLPLPTEEASIASETEPQRRGFVRVDVLRLDDAMEQLSALIVTRSRLARAVAELKAAGVGVRELAEIVKDNTRQLRDLRAAILRVRMVPIVDVLDRVPLIVRGLRRESGKHVRLVVDVGNAELDKAVADRIFPAIVHLVRNAVDHAIELPAERLRLGKPEEGTLSITCAAHSNTRLELTISDDGMGVDRAGVVRRAGRELEDDSALLDAMCLPGLSTSGETSTTSGRGMGMDIVKRIVVDQLGGELFMRTEPGKGTTFVLRVPLTIAIVDAFVIECAAHRFIVPVSAVEEILEIDHDKVKLAPSRHGTVAPLAMVQRRAETLPLLDLASLLRLRPLAERPRQALVVRRGGEALAFAVHRVVGQQEAVVRPLVDPLVQVQGISGAADLGNGRPTLVLDLASLSATRGMPGRERAA